MTAAAKPKTIVEALSAVMEDVQGVRKSDRNTQQNYSFRGIDAVVNAVGPVLRKHGVVVVPTGVSCESEHYQTARGTPMRGITLTVTFRFYGPGGDHIEATVCGEASDSGDKAVPKAHSVAYRTLLLQALCIPTDEPDPDSESHDRARTQRANGNGGSRANQDQLQQIETVISEVAQLRSVEPGKIKSALTEEFGVLSALSEEQAFAVLGKLGGWKTKLAEATA